MFSKILIALGLAPKNLDEARSTYTEAKGTLDSVAALFTAANLPLDKMIAEGPDSLKAHLASVDNSAELTRLGAELKTAQAEAKRIGDELAAANAKIKAHAEIFATVGLDVKSDTKPEDAKKAFADHTSKATTLALAKTGHPPAHVPAADATLTGAVATDAQLAADYDKLPRGPEKQAFYAKHERALWRHEKAGRNKAE
jgi:hypothetical protein